MESPIKQIVRFNEQAGLLNKPYDDFLESSFQVEEALEGFPQEGIEELASQLSEEHYEPQDANPKALSRVIVHIAQNGYFLDEKDKKSLTDVDRLDKACDSIVYAVGSIAKLGLSPQQITTALNIVMKKNFEKLGCKTDAHGKLGKPQDFIGPEAQLQLLLDQRK